MKKTITVDGYSVDVTNDGKYIAVNGVPRKQSLVKPKGSTRGFYQVTIYKNKKLYVHRLVAIAFIKNPHNYPKVLHINTNTVDNHVVNLMWGVSKDVYTNIIASGRELEFTTSANLFPHKKEIVRMLSNGKSLKEIAEIYNTSDMSIHRFKKRWKLKSNTDCDHYDKRIKKAAKELLKTKSTMDVAKLLDIPYHTVYRWFKKIRNGQDNL